MAVDVRRDGGSINEGAFSTWLKNSRLIEKKDDTLFVALPSNFAKTWVEEKYQKNIIGIVRNMDNSVKKIEFVVGNKNFPTAKTAPEVQEAQKPNEGTLDFNKTDPETGLNPKYTLASFVVGPSNELAFAAANAITEEHRKKI